MQLVISLVLRLRSSRAFICCGSWVVVFGTRYPLKAEASKKGAASCNACHQKNAKSDWVFSQYYPVLRAATPRSK